MRSIILPLLFAILALLAGYTISKYSPATVFWVLPSLVIFIVAFIKIEWGLYILIFSMLLSPEIIIGETGGGTLGRGVTLRFEDFLMVIIGFSWFAKNAIFKELGLFLKTPLNKAILFYVLACLLSTGFGIMTGRVGAKTGSLFLLKYVEYFIVFFMVANHVKNIDQIKRFVFCLFLTCFIVSIIGFLQIPSGQRVSAPFEGEIGEPNTLGGYLLFIGAIATGLLLKTKDPKTKKVLALLIVCIIPSFLFTQSRTSYLALIPVVFVFSLFTRRKMIIVGALIVSLLMSPLFLPSVVNKRISHTFNQPEESGQMVIGNIRLDTSTSARLISWRNGVKAWTKHPVIGYGVTGYSFVDAQFLRVLVETGATGLLAFIYLLYSIFKLAIKNLRNLETPYFKGLSIGFLAGYIGLLVHTLGANTFIIVRIMEPFWFFVGIMAVLPMLEYQHPTRETGSEVSPASLASAP
jgi:O-antigen ligase